MSLQIFSAELSLSCGRPDQLPALDLPETALVGRSNVGKSSLINALVRRHNLARRSNTPGKTRLVNFYAVEVGNRGGRDRLLIVDTPGYGYARASHTERRRFDNLMTAYLASRRPTLRRVVLICDLRHPGMGSDLEAWEWLKDLGYVRLAVATKADKLSKNEAAKNLSLWRKALEMEPLAFSAVDNRGRDALWPLLLGEERKPHPPAPPANAS